MTAAGKKRLMVLVVGLWMSLKHFINHSCTYKKLTEMLCVPESKWSQSSAARFNLFSNSHLCVTQRDPSITGRESGNVNPAREVLNAPSLKLIGYFYSLTSDGNSIFFFLPAHLSCSKPALFQVRIKMSK